MQNGWLRTTGRKLDRRQEHAARAGADPARARRRAAARRPLGEGHDPALLPGPRVPRGSRIRLEIGAPGGDQPVWAFAGAAEGTAKVQIARSPRHPSRLVLPFIRASARRRRCRPARACAASRAGPTSRWPTRPRARRSRRPAARARGTGVAPPGAAPDRVATMRRPLALAVLVLALLRRRRGRGGLRLQHPPAGAVRRVPGTPANHGTDQIPLYDALTPLRGNVTAADIAKNYKPENFAPIGASTVEPTTRARRRPDDPARQLRRPARLRQDPRGHLVRRGLGDGRGPRAAARARAASRPTRPSPTCRASTPSASSPAAAASRPAPRPRRSSRPAAQARPSATARRAGRSSPTCRTTPTASPPTGAARTRRPRRGRSTTASPSPRSSARSSATAAATRSRNSDFLARLRGRLGAKRGGQAFARPHGGQRPRGADDDRQALPLRRSCPTADQGLAARRPGLDRRRSAGAAAADASERLASNFLVVGAEPLGHRRADGRHGPAARLLLPGDRHRGRPARPRHQRAGRRSPRRQPLRPDRAHAALRLEPDDRRQRQHRRVPRAALRPGRPPTRADHYVYKASASRCTTFDAGTLGTRATARAKALRYHVTVHGPVQGTVHGQGQAVRDRQGRARPTGRTRSASRALRDMTVGGRLDRRSGFYKAANEFGFTFNWAYASRKHVAYFSSGKLPIRARARTSCCRRSAPASTTGRASCRWRGTRTRADPKSGLLLNWNNKPAPGWEAGEDNLSYGSVHRVEAFYHFPRRPGSRTSSRS